MCFFLGFRAISDIFLLPILLLGGHGIEAHTAYRLYFYSYWATYAAESVLGLLLIYSIFNLAMAPLEGLKNLGTLIFRWAASISVAIALVSALTPHFTQMSFITNFVTELQRTQSILTLCLLLFVCFAIRPMGLSYSSRIFGVSLGLGLLATTNLVASAWMAHFKEMYSTINTATGVATCFVLLLWITYFALPEPRRRMIVLPTTSPFLRWNQISQVLGDEPGFVAIGGIPPELFAPAELEIMRRASLKMSTQPTAALQHSQTA
ncbi:hypothetical protein [Granulicella arctica]|uniref:hypothetical protein n=1 Tax=Granulicella arctica TaxID=940613 RepID=UPI0021DFD74C|nr:hypothetical protein [Granulicella arctica]